MTACVLCASPKLSYSDYCHNYYCGYAPFTENGLSQFIAFKKLLWGPNLTIAWTWAGNADPTFETAYFEPCAYYNGYNAWDVATDVSFTAGGSWSTSNIYLALVTDQDIWDLVAGGGGTVGGHTATRRIGDQNPPGPFIDNVAIYINLAYIDDQEEWWYGCSAPPDNEIRKDMQSIITHEIGHALGFDDIADGLEGCSVMTGYVGDDPDGPGGIPRWRQAIGLLDRDAVSCYYPPPAVGDIHSFSAVASGHNVNMSFELSANPQQTNAIYVSDNPMGPAQRITLLNPPGQLIPTVNTCTDTYRLAPQGTYYYWMDHDVGGFASIRNPTGLFASPTVPTISSSPSGINRPVKDSPEVISVRAPSGVGRAEVTWQPSSDNTSLDWYNVYRNAYPNGQSSQGEWVWLANVATNKSSFVDLSAPVGVTTEYWISAAHHGAYAVNTGTANQGIWNEFSPNAGKAVSGLISVNTTWSGTVFVSGDVRVAQGVTLTISPGTTAYVWPSDPNHADNTAAGGVDPNRCEIWVDGSLRAVGYQAQPIKFVAYDASGPTTDDDAWYGFFVTSTGSATFHDCTIRNARYGVGAQGNVTLRSSTIQYAEKRGISAAYNNSISIRNSTIRDIGEYGINLAQHATLHIAQSTIKNVGINGMLIASGSVAYVDTVTCRDNATAIYVDRDAPSYTVSTTV